MNDKRIIHKAILLCLAGVFSTTFLAVVGECRENRKSVRFPLHEQLKPVNYDCSNNTKSLETQKKAANLASDEKNEEELIRLENRMMESFKNGDKALLEEIIGDEFLLTSATSQGNLISKKAYIEGGIGQIKVESFRFHDFRVRLFGDTAIVNCRIDWKSTWGKERWDADFLMTDVWVKRNGRWQIVTRHSSYPAKN